MNNQLTKRRNPFEKPLQPVQEEVKLDQQEKNVEEFIEENVVEEFKNQDQPIEREFEPIYAPQPQPQRQSQPQYYEQKTPSRQKNQSQNVVTRETKQYYASTNEVSRDKFTSTMETSLRRSIKIVCAQRGIMFAQFVEDACREKLRREGIR